MHDRSGEPCNVRTEVLYGKYGYSDAWQDSCDAYCTCTRIVWYMHVHCCTLLSGMTVCHQQAGDLNQWVTVLETSTCMLYTKVRIWQVPSWWNLSMSNTPVISVDVRLSYSQCGSMSFPSCMLPLLRNCYALSFVLGYSVTLGVVPVMTSEFCHFCLSALLYHSSILRFMSYFSQRCCICIDHPAVFWDAAHACTILLCSEILSLCVPPCCVLRYCVCVHHPVLLWNTDAVCTTPLCSEILSLCAPLCCVLRYWSSVHHPAFSEILYLCSPPCCILRYCSCVHHPTVFWDTLSVCTTLLCSEILQLCTTLLCSDIL